MSYADKGEILTPVEVAQALRVSLSSVYRLFRAGTLRGFRAGSSVRIYTASVRELMEAKPATPREVKAKKRAEAKGSWVLVEPP